MSRSAEQRIEDILEAIAHCERYRERFSDPDPEVIEMAFWAAVRYIAVIGEAANQLPDEVTAALPDIEWAAVVGMRNTLIHQYYEVDPEIVTRVLDYRLEPLAAALREFLVR